MKILAITEPSSFASNWLGRQLDASKLHHPGQLVGFDSILLCPEKPTSDFPVQVNEWRQEGSIWGDLIGGTYKCRNFADLPNLAAWVTHCEPPDDHPQKDISHFIPLALQDTPIHRQPLGYAFCGGRKDRDFQLALDAAQLSGMRMLFVSDKLPPDMEPVRPRRVPLTQYTEMIALSRFVVVPVKQGQHPHGHSDVVRAKLAKRPLLITKGGSCDQYIGHKVNGYLAEPTIGDMAAGMVWLNDNHEKLAPALEACRERYTFDAYNRDLMTLCETIHKGDKPNGGRNDT